jgi:hypothetical protein
MQKEKKIKVKKSNREEILSENPNKTTNAIK